MEKISAVVITFNEEKKIAACLASLQGVVDEIVVMDNFSTDSTPLICKQFGVKFYQQSWKGYGQQKNEAVAKCSHHYILSIDADEYLSTELQQTILQQKKSKLLGAYTINRLNIFYGYTLKYGLTQPDKIIRLYDRRQAQWSLTAVHETLNFNTNVAITFLKGNLIHKSKDSMHAYIDTLNKYSTLGAAAYYSKGKKSSIFKIIANPTFTFFKGYIFRLGFLDGMPGLIMAITLSIDTFMKYAKLYFIQKNKLQ